MSLWAKEFDSSYDIPDVILKAEGIEDLSWHHDICPSFGRYVAQGGEEHAHCVRIWVEHPDPERREYQNEGRFMVNYFSDGEAAPLLNDAVAFYSGDDAPRAVQVFLETLTILYIEVRKGEPC